MGPLNAEVECAEEYWIKKAQGGLSAGIVKGSFESLSPFVKDEGIVRVGGRVDAVLVSYYGTHVALLPQDHWVSVLVTHNVFASSRPSRNRKKHGQSQKKVLGSQREQN